MTIEVPFASRVGRTQDVLRAWLETSRRQSAVALCVYALVSIGFFGLHVLPHLGRECACAAGSDPETYMWYLSWFPHAVLHGPNPFVTSAVFAPDRLEIGSVAPAGPAILAAPATLLFGPFVSYNLVALASRVLAAFLAFLLCRYVSRSFAAALVGGYLFGFSAYMLGHMLGHLNLVLVFPIPAAVHLTLRLIDGRISERKFAALMALALAALLLFSTELALTFVLLGAISLGVTFVLAPFLRHRLTTAVRWILAAGALAALVTSPMLYYALQANPTSGFETVGDVYGGDALGFLIPTDLIRLGWKSFAAVSATFNQGNGSESGIYLGLPLALIVTRYAITRWRLASTRILVSVLAVIGVLLLGVHLHIAGHPTILLPWYLLDHSLLREVVPVSLGIYVFLIVAVIAAMWGSSSI